MIPVFSRNKQLRQRAEILRGVYEDNLRIIGRRRTKLANRKTRILKKVSLITFIAVFSVLMHGNYLHPPFFEERQVTAGLISQRPFSSPAAPDKKMVEKDLADYRAFVTNGGPPIKRTFGLGIKTIMIDPGHGGADVGTTGKLGTREKDIALDIAKRLKSRLEKYGRFNVLMTRNEDITVPLNQRVQLALSKKADLFISVHLNYLPAKPINIIETYYFGPSSDSKVLSLAEQENAGSNYGMSDFKEIIEKIGNTMKLQESRRLASSIQKDLFQNFKKDAGNAYDFGVKRAPFVVLLGVDIPAVLAEVSCLSNREEEMKLNTAGHREHIANYLEKGILDYLHKGEETYEADRRAEKL